MKFFTVLKDPDAQSDYAFDWSLWLALGDSIGTSLWTVPAELTKVAASATGTIATVWLKGGVAGKTYVVTNRITTVSNPNRIEPRSIQIQVEKR